MRHLSLFTGVGGGDLAHQHLLGWQTVGYVEFDKYCQQVLSQRIEDGFLQEAPIFGDIDHFIESGAAKKYQGYVDVVTAGFPCQPFSVAGKQAGEDDPRNKWPQTIQCIRDIRPRYALLENVPGLLNSGYFPEILGSLAEAGFDARWIVLGADDCFAPHRRKRLWILADSDSIGLEKYGHSESTDAVVTGQVADSESARLQTRGGDRVGTDHGSRRNKGQSEGACGETEDVADSDSPGLSQRRGAESVETQHTTAECSSEGQPSSYWPTEPRLGRVTSDGVANRVDRLKAIGNGQVSRVAAVAWRILNDTNG